MGRPARNDPDVKKVSSLFCANVLGISRTLFLKHVRLGNLPPGIKEKYDLNVVVQTWVKFNMNARTAAGVFDAKKSLLEQKYREAKMENDVRERKLVELDDVDDAFTEAMTIVAMRMDGMSGRLANELAGISDPAVIRQRLRNELISIRAAASNGLADFVGHPQRSKDLKPTPDPDSGSVGGRVKNPPRRIRRAGTV
jgi:hypothetical protein